MWQYAYMGLQGGLKCFYSPLPPPPPPHEYQISPHLHGVGSIKCLPSALGNWGGGGGGGGDDEGSTFCTSLGIGRGGGGR